MAFNLLFTRTHNHKNKSQNAPALLEQVAFNIQFNKCRCTICSLEMSCEALFRLSIRYCSWLAHSSRLSTGDCALRNRTIPDNLSIFAPGIVPFDTRSHRNDSVF